jgi:hypothetical protein
MRRAACLGLLALVAAAGAGDVAAQSRKGERSYVSYLRVRDVGTMVRWGFFVCLPRPARLRWQIEVRSLTTREIDRYTHFFSDRQGRNCTYYELELRDLRSRFDPDDRYRTRVTVRLGRGRVIHSKAKPLRVKAPASAEPR